MILIVDDEPMARNLLRLMLVRDGFDVIEATDGRDALAKLERNLPSLVILDVMMPIMDGLTLCRTMRARPEMADIPVIMLSARTDAKSRREGLAAGATRYLNKPITADQLTHHVRATLD